MRSFVLFCILAAVQASQGDLAEKTEIAPQKPVKFEIGNKSYTISGSKGDWYLAKIECRLQGMELLSIESQDEQDAVLAEIIGYDEPFWISGNDHGKEGFFFWDSTGNYLGPFLSYATDQPDGGAVENCLMLDNVNGFLWADTICADNAIKRFICEDSTLFESFVDSDGKLTLCGFYK